MVKLFIYSQTACSAYFPMTKIVKAAGFAKAAVSQRQSLGILSQEMFIELNHFYCNGGARLWCLGCRKLFGQKQRRICWAIKRVLESCFLKNER